MEDAMKLTHGIIVKDPITFDQDFGVEICFRDKYHYFISYVRDNNTPKIIIGQDKCENIVAKVILRISLEEVAAGSSIPADRNDIQIQMINRNFNPALIYLLIMKAELSLA